MLRGLKLESCVCHLCVIELIIILIIKCLIMMSDNIILKL